MIFCPAAKEKKKRKNITKRVVFAFENFYSLSLCAYSLNRSPYPRGTHTHIPNFRSFCALPFAAFRRIDFAGVCLSGVCSFKRRECVDSQPLSVLFVVCVCSYFLPKGGIKNSPFMPHFLTHINTYLYARTKMAPTTQQKILAAYNGLYGTTFALSVLHLVLSWLLRAAGHFLLHHFSPKANFVIIV